MQHENGLKSDNSKYIIYTRVIRGYIIAINNWLASAFNSVQNTLCNQMEKCTKSGKCAIYSRVRAILKIFSHLNCLFVYEY